MREHGPLCDTCLLSNRFRGNQVQSVFLTEIACGSQDNVTVVVIRL